MGTLMGSVHVDMDTSNNRLNTVKNTNPLKTKYLDFVLLMDTEYKALVDKFGDARVKGMIEKLNNYIGSKGKKYKSHYHTILVWFSKEEPIKKGKTGEWNAL
jgi:hypothetical protein